MESNALPNLQPTFPLGNVIVDLPLIKIGEQVSPREQLIIDNVGINALIFIQQHCDIQSLSTHIVPTAKNYLSGGKNDAKSIVSLQKFNSIKEINYFFEESNKALASSGKFIGYIKTNNQRKSERFISRIPLIRSAYNSFEFGFHRVFPRLKGCKKVYNFLTGAKFQRLSKAEICGRFVRAGFKLIEVNDDINGHLFFVGEKTGEPKLDDTPSYGPLYKMPRIGKNGKVIGVYKFRTMHPYSEYLQDYIIRTNGYGINGKPANDFRVTRWGKLLRRYWLDELPQLINVFKGEMKLVGVRPVSRRYFQDIPQHLREMRLQQKPGCIPPYVAFDKKNSKESVLKSEETYLTLINERKTNDTKLMINAIRNIVFRGKRSA